jgi:hypothetical protein
MWADAYDNSDFEVSNAAKVRHKQTQKAVTPVVDIHGYANICFGGRAYRLHRLVAISFFGFPKEGLVCCHIDGNKLNNNLDNLQYKTQKENIHDKYKHGTMFRGKKAPAAKYGKEVTDKILALYTHKTCREISDEVGISFGTVAKVVRYHKGRRRARRSTNPALSANCPLAYLKTLVNQAQRF